MAGHGLTYRQKAFVREFVRLGNVLQAARAAGVKGAESAGYRMMRSARVQAAIKEAQETPEARLAGATAEALERVWELMENATTDAVRLRAAQEVLDRARGGRPSGEGREDGGMGQEARTLLDYSDPAAVAARVEELLRRRGKGGRDADEG